MNSNIVITGEGIVCAIGLNKQQVLQSLLHKQTGVGVMKHLRSTHHELPVGEVPMSNDDRRSELGITDQYVNRTTLMGILAVRQALADAGITEQRSNGAHRACLRHYGCRNGGHRTFL